MYCLKLNEYAFQKYFYLVSLTSYHKIKQFAKVKKEGTDRNKVL